MCETDHHRTDDTESGSRQNYDCKQASLNCCVCSNVTSSKSTSERLNAIVIIVILPECWMCKHALHCRSHLIHQCMNDNAVRIF